MKRTKQLIAVILTAVMLLGLYACSNSKNGENEQTPSTSSETIAEPTATATPTATPTATENAGDTVRINIGGEEYIDMIGNTWEASKMYTSGSYGAQNGNLFTIVSDIENTDKPELYQTMLYDNPIGLKFDNLTPGKYKVKLYMIEPVFNDSVAGGRVVDILINGKTYLKDVNMGKDVGFMTAYEPEFVIEVKQDEELIITQTASVDMGVYCAVEITPAGDEALTTPLD